MEVSIRELEKKLPYVVRDKARYYLDYVNDRLFEIALEEGVYDRLVEIRSEAEIIFLLRLLYSFFVIGFRNYDGMLDYLGSKDIDGFQIGRANFTRQSTITQHWQEVASELDHLVGTTRIASFVRPGLSVETVIRQIIQSLPPQPESKLSDE